MVYKLYADIQPVKGFCRSILYDFGKQKKWFIPNTLLSLINKDLSFKKEIFTDKYSEYLKFLNENNLIFAIPSNLNKSFPVIKYEHFDYSIINNIVIHLNVKSNIKNVISYIIHLENKLYCYNYIFILDENLNAWSNKIKTLINDPALENVVSIGIKSFVNDENELTEFLKENKRINSLFLCTDNVKTTTFKGNYNSTVIYYVPNILEQEESVLNPQLFSINIILFNESQKHNTYFNRKLYIGLQGEIKNSSETTEILGNINEVVAKNELLNISNSKVYQKYWHVNKGTIDVCKHCEFRHMCVDNRVPLKRNEKEWFMGYECNYNPYIAKWKYEVGYKTLIECGIESNISNFKINRRKLNAVNKELWGDD